MDTEKVKKDHKKKSNQVKKLQRKLKNKTKNTIPLSTLKKMLLLEKQYKMDHLDYYSWGSYDDQGYRIDQGKKEAKIELLEELIRMTESKKR